MRVRFSCPNSDPWSWSAFRTWSVDPIWKGEECLQLWDRLLGFGGDIVWNWEPCDRAGGGQ